MTSIVSLFAWLLGVAVLILDYTVYYTVVNMGSYLSHLTAIGVTWRILRDIGNILLIFGFLGIGISVILNASWYGGKTKMLPMLLVAAIFLNFSLFFAEAIIDVGNLFATQFYTQINGGVTPTAFSISTVSVANEGISNKLMAQLGLQAIYSNGTTNTAVFTQANPWYVGFMGIILFMVTAFVMLSLAFILIARFVKLVYLIIIAPIGFAGLAVPQLAGRAKEWWGSLFEQTITAPVLLLLLYVALAVITDAQFLTGLGGGGAGAATGFVANANLPGFASYLLSFTIAIALLIAVAMSATRLGAFGGSWATKSAGALTLGATALGMRATVGRTSRGLAQVARRSGLGDTARGRLLISGLDKGAKASFDARGTKFGGQLGAGEAAKGGFAGSRERSIKGHEEYAKSVGAAYDERGATRTERKNISAAEAKREETDKDVIEATKQHDVISGALDQQIKEQEAEVTRLEESKKTDQYWVTDPANEQKLAAAKQTLATSKESLEEAAKIKDDFIAKAAAAKKDQDAITKDSGDRISSEKKEASLAYAKNITGSPLGWILSGSGGGAGAKAIIKKAKTKETDLEKTIKASIKAEVEAQGKKTNGH
jgi:hypothetical protein